MKRLLALAALAPLAACGSHDPDPSQQVGPAPILPAPHEGILPEISVPKVVGWKAGEAL